MGKKDVHNFSTTLLITSVNSSLFEHGSTKAVLSQTAF